MRRVEPGLPGLPGLGRGGLGLGLGLSIGWRGGRVDLDRVVRRWRLEVVPFEHTGEIASD